MHLGAPQLDGAHRGAFSQQRNAQYRAMSQLPGKGAALRELIHLGLKIVHVHSPTIEDGAAGDGPAHDRDQEPDGTENRPMVGSDAQVVFLTVEEDGIVGSAEASRALDHGIQHGLDVRRRAADHPEDLCRRGLLLQRLAQIAVAGLQFRGQAGVLDGDRGLLGEGPEQLDLA